MQKKRTLWKQQASLKPASHVRPTCLTCSRRGSSISTRERKGRFCMREKRFCIGQEDQQREDYIRQEDESRQCTLSSVPPKKLSRERFLLTPRTHSQVTNQDARWRLSGEQIQDWSKCAKMGLVEGWCGQRQSQGILPGIFRGESKRLLRLLFCWFSGQNFFR